MYHCLPESCKIVQALAPAADAAGRTGAYVNLKNVKKAWVVCNITQGNAATIQLDVKQASAIAGTGVKALANAIPIWANLDAATSDALVRATDAVNYTTDAGVKNKVVVFQVDPFMLDTNGGFDCITVVTGASNAANITAAVYVLDMRYAGATPPSVVVD
jgi:hypothetical protein